MDYRSLPDDIWIEKGPDLFRVVIGGDRVWDIIVSHWRGHSWRQIEEEHGVPRETARRWVTIAKQNLRQAGLDADAVRSVATWSHYHANA